MKVAIYCRLSEEDRNKQFETDDSNSIQNQKAMLLQYAMEQGWELYNIYSDDDYTGSDRRRPEFNRLLKDAEAHKFDIILCKTQSRFTRELELVEKYIHGLFPIWGIRFISIVDNADTANKGNKKSRQINGLVNEWYLEDMSENIRSVLTNRRVNGFHIGAFALYGYKKDPEQKGHLIIDEEAAVVVREVFTLFAQGYGKTAIARMLNDRGIPNPTEYKRLHGLRYKQPKTKNSTLWKYFAISDMLINEIYIGNMVQGRSVKISYKSQKCLRQSPENWVVVEGTHEPIIDPETFQKVQLLVNSRKHTRSRTYDFLLKGLIFCHECGYPMAVLNRKNAAGEDRLFFVCRTYQRFTKAGICTCHSIKEETVNEAVFTKVREVCRAYLHPDKLCPIAKEAVENASKAASCDAEMQAMQSKITALTTNLDQMYMDRLNGLLSEEDFQRIYQKVKMDRTILEDRLKSFQEQAKQPVNTEEKAKALVKQFLDSALTSRELLVSLIERVELTEDKQIIIKFRFRELEAIS